MAESENHEAEFWQPLDGNRVQCGLCRHECVIAAGSVGRCRVRKNIDGRLVSLTYGKLIAAAADPIEKKPLYHVLPGTKSMSIASVGCNFSCKFCQNWSISQADLAEGKYARPASYAAPGKLVNFALAQQCRSISYTYTEPTVFFEYARDCAKIARANGLLNCFVSNGFLSDAAIDEISPYLSAINVDLKAFDEQTYTSVTGGKLSGVLAVLKKLYAAGIWIEVTTLVVPGLNDSDSELGDIAGFIADELSSETPWHISRYHDDYEFTGKGATSAQSLANAAAIGAAAGLKYVYRGNIDADGIGDTFCPSCGELVIKRTYMGLRENKLIDGTCPHCKTKIAGLW